MKVQELMTHHVETCRPEDMLARAAQIMWDHDCGFVPVVDENACLVGVLTDRDISMAAYTQGLSLADIQVASAMAAEVWTCRPEDTLVTAERIMRDHQVRRLPVIEGAGQVVGVLSLNDLAREAQHERTSKAKELTTDEVTLTLASVCQPRLPSLLATNVH